MIYFHLSKSHKTQLFVCFDGKKQYYRYEFINLRQKKYSGKI
jgi:hypothetical protein